MFGACTVVKDTFSFLAMTPGCLFIFLLQVLFKIFVVSSGIKYEGEKRMLYILTFYSHPFACTLLLKTCSLFLCSVGSSIL